MAGRALVDTVLKLALAVLLMWKRQSNEPLHFTDYSDIALLVKPICIARIYLKRICMHARRVALRCLL